MYVEMIKKFWQNVKIFGKLLKKKILLIYKIYKETMLYFDKELRKLQGKYTIFFAQVGRNVLNSYRSL